MEGKNRKVDERKKRRTGRVHRECKQVFSWSV